MGKKLDELDVILNMYKEQANEVSIFEEDKFFKTLRMSLLTDIARSLAIIADKLTEDNYAKDK